MDRKLRISTILPTLLFTLPVFLHLVSPAFAEIGHIPNSKPFLNVQGKYQTDVFTGTANYSYPINVPKGTNDLTPDVSLSYNSSAAYSFFSSIGTGWQVSRNYVERDVNYTPADGSTGDDKYKLHFQGATYDLIYVASENRYHTKQESFLNIQKLTGGQNSYGDYWQVITPDGTKHRFGYQSQSEHACNGHSYINSWNLDQTEDTHGNKIFYTYLDESDYTGLSKIEYNNSLAHKVEFSYTSITSTSVRRWNYQQGCDTSEPYLLQNIKVKTNNALVRQYDFGFTVGENKQSLLSSITEKGSDGSSLPATTFSYKPEVKSWNTTKETWINNVNIDSHLERTDTTLSDVNGDGYLDIVRTEKPGNVHWKVLLNQGGNGWPTTFDYWVNNQSMEDARLDRTDVRLMDVTGDNLPDIVMAASASNWRVWRNTGSSWNTSYEQWGNLSGYGSDLILSNNRVALVDVTGDGLPDIVNTWWNGSQEWRVFRNTGSGWNGSPEVWSTGSNGGYGNGLDDPNTMLIDVNGDGLVDILSSSRVNDKDKWVLYRNTGYSWRNGSGETWLDYNRGAQIADENVGVADVNGDGLPEIIHVTDQGTQDYWEVLLNHGQKWETVFEQWIFGSANMDVDFAGEDNVRIADVDGDSLADIVKTGYSGVNATWDVYRNNGDAPKLLSSVKTAQGGTATFDYTPSTTFDNTGADALSDLRFPMWLVTKKTENNGMTGTQQTNDVITYNYQDGSYDTEDKEFRGFASIDEVASGAAKKKYVFHQDDALKGMMSEVQTRNLQDNPYAETENTWSSSLTNGVYTLKLDTQKEYTYDGSATNPKIMQTNFLYDNYGNVTKQSDLGDTSVTGDERFTYNDYTYNNTSWIVNTLSHTYKHAANDTTKVSESWNYYDTHTALNDSPTKGDVTKNVQWLSGGTNPETTETYDSFGNKLTVTDAKNHTTTYAYESTGTYATSITNAKNHTSTTSYDLGTGNVLSETDPNGFVTSYEYDAFGRITKEIKPYDSSSTPTTKYTYYLDGIAPERTLVSKRETSSSSATLDTYTFVDGFGRKIQTRTDAEDETKQRVVDTFYDSLGEVKKETVPYLATSSAVAAPTPSPTPALNLTDATSNGNNITNNGATLYTTNYAFVESGGAANFAYTSGNWMGITQSSVLRPTQWTIMANVKRVGTPGNAYTIFANWGDANAKMSGMMLRINYENRLQAFNAYNTGQSTNDLGTATGGTVLAENTWYHVAATYDGSTIRVYLNGALDGSVSASAPVYDAANDGVAIGKRGNEPSPNFDYYNGQITHVNFWNRPLTATEISSTYYNKLLTGSESGLVGYWPIAGSAKTPDPAYGEPDATAKFTEFTYDVLARPIIIKNPKGDNKTIAYDHGKETTIDENGNIKRKFANAYGKIDKVEEVLDGTTLTTTYEYDTLDNLTKITDHPGNHIVMTYDTLGRRSTQVDPDMGTWTYAYDGVGNLTSQTDNRNVTVAKTYDELNRVTLVNYPTDTDTTYTYDGNSKLGTLTSVVDTAGTVNYSYDNRLRKTQEARTVNGTTKTTNFSYDAADRTVTQTNPDGEVVTYAYNNQGEVNSVTGTTGILSNVDYNAQGKITKKDFANGLSTNYTYSTNDFRLNRIQTGSLQDLNYTYDAVGNIATITDGLTTKTQTFSYDDLDRLKTASESANGYNYAYDYNAIGNLTKFTNAGVAIDYTYGANGKPHAMTSSTATGSATQTPTNIAPNGTGYRWWQNTSSTSDANKVAATGINDNNMTQGVALNSATENADAWEAAGVTWTTTQDNVTSVEYTNGDLTSENDGVFTANFKLQFTTDGTTWTDSGWSVTPAYDYGSPSSSGGQTFTFTGTATSIKGARVVGQVHTGQAWSWHAIAKELKVIAGTSQTTTATPALVQKQKGSGGGTGSVATSFTNNVTAGNTIVVMTVTGSGSNLDTTSVTDNQGNTYTQIGTTQNTPGNAYIRMWYAKNVTGGAVTVTAHQSGSASGCLMEILEYSGLSTTAPADQAASTTGNSTSPSGGSITPTSDKALILSAFVDDNSDNVSISGTSGYTVEESDLINSNSFRNGIESLIQSTAGATTGTWTTGSSADWAAAIVSFKPEASTTASSSGMTYTYDANGNMTSDGEKCYDYNEANQMDKVTTCSNNQTIAEYVYDYTGMRMVKRNFTSGTLANTVTSWSDSYETKVIVGEATENTTYYFANKELIAKKNSDGTKQYHHNDHLGSSSIITNQSGTLLEETKYDPWGKISAGGTKSKFLYTGQEHDDETSLDYYNYRYYNSDIRRFAQPDDIIQDWYTPQTLNRYSYVMNNPLRYTDPTGHYAETALDVAFISMDVNSIKQDPSNVWNYAALAGDVLGAAAPGLTGVGLGIRVVEHGGDISKLAKTGNSGKATQNVIKQNSQTSNAQKAAASQRQMKEPGRVIAGGDSKKVFRDAPIVAKQYGGKSSDWIKKVSSDFRSADKGNTGKFQTHWVENVKTGFRTLYKTVFTPKKKR